MSNREFTAQRTMLANAFATAGAELLECMGTAAALAAIPNTEPPQYVVAGTLRMIGKMLPNDEAQPLYDDNGEPWNEAAEREVAAEKPTGDLTPVTTLTGEQLHKFYVEASGGVDEGLVAVANAAIAAHLERQAQAKDKHLPGWERGIATVTLTGHQLRAALDCINPDGDEDADQLDDWLTFGIVQHMGDDGTASAGMCCWNDDTDGVLPLDGEYTAAPASQEGAHAAPPDDLRKFDRETTEADHSVLNLAATFSTARQFGREFNESGLLSFVDALGACAVPDEAMGHSPLPWKRQSKTGANRWRIVDADGRQVADINHYCEKAEANMARILAALKTQASAERSGDHG
jgi:hypothetical protein